MGSTSDATLQANRSGMTPQRLVWGFLMLLVGIGTLFLGHIFDNLWQRLGWRNAEIIEGQLRTTTLLALLVAVGGGVAVMVTAKWREQAEGVADELMKVTWPSMEETRVSTMAVVVASLVAAVILFGMDTLSYHVMVEWLPKIWGTM